MSKIQKQQCEILACPECDDRDCKLNVCGLCHNIGNIIEKIPSGICTCSEAKLEFTRTDYLELDNEQYQETDEKYED